MKKNIADSLIKHSEENYDIISREFSDTRAYFWRELENLKNFVKDGDVVADIGCGNGRLLDLFEGKNITVTGIDSSNNLIKLAQKKYGDQATFIHGNALGLPLPDNSVDAVYSIGMLHHVPSKKYRQQSITEMYRILKPRGKLILTVWNMWHPKFYKQLFMSYIKKIVGISKLEVRDIIAVFGQRKQERFLHAHTKSELIKLCKKAGFTDMIFSVEKRKSGYSNYLITAQKPLS